MVILSILLLIGLILAAYLYDRSHAWPKDFEHGFTQNRTTMRDYAVPNGDDQ